MIIEELIERVRVLIDEHSPFSDAELLVATEEEGYETKPITTYIDRSIDEAADEMLYSLPLHMIEPSQMVILQHIKNSDGTGILGIGDDFLRIHTLKFKSWQRPIHINYMEEDPITDLQYNPYTMGTPHKPVVVLHKNNVVLPMNKALYYYSCGRGDRKHELEIAWQVSRFDRGNIQDDLADLFALNCAARVLSIMGMNEQARAMSERLSAGIQLRSR